VNGDNSTISRSGIRRAIALRVKQTGLAEAQVVHGAKGAPNGPAAVFGVGFLGNDAGELRGESGGTLATSQRFAVELLHRAQPTAGPDVWDTQIDDEARVRHVLLTSPTVEDVLRPWQHRIIYLGTDDPTIEGAGAYRRIVLHFRIGLHESLE
jgi:hypothetical protein